jgi:hypothetical protein
MGQISPSHTLAFEIFRLVGTVIASSPTLTYMTLWLRLHLIRQAPKVWAIRRRGTNVIVSRKAEIQGHGKRLLNSPIRHNLCHEVPVSRSKRFARSMESTAEFKDTMLITLFSNMNSSIVVRQAHP